MVRAGIFGTPGAVEWGLLSRQNHRKIEESEGILHYPWVYGLCLKRSTLRRCMHNKLGPHSTPILGDYRQNREGLGCTEAMMVVNNDLIANFHGLLWKHVIWVLEWMFSSLLDWLNPLEAASIHDFINPVCSMPTTLPCNFCKAIGWCSALQWLRTLRWQWHFCSLWWCCT